MVKKLLTIFRNANILATLDVPIHKLLNFNELTVLSARKAPGMGIKMVVCVIVAPARY